MINEYSASIEKKKESASITTLKQAFKLYIEESIDDEEVQRILMPVLQGRQWGNAK